jgi:hypothetical protein
MACLGIDGCFASESPAGFNRNARLLCVGTRIHALVPGLTARRVLEKFAAVQMIDVHLPTTDAESWCCPDTPNLSANSSF